MKYRQIKSETKWKESNHIFIPILLDDIREHMKIEPYVVADQDHNCSMISLAIVKVEHSTSKIDSLSNLLMIMKTVAMTMKVRTIVGTKTSNVFCQLRILGVRVSLVRERI